MRTLALAGFLLARLSIAFRSANHLGAESPLFNFDELHWPSFSEHGVHSQNFAHTDDKGTTRLKYQGTLAENVHFIHLDRHPDVLGLNCPRLFADGDKGMIDVFFKDEKRVSELLASELPIIVTGGLGWGCEREGIPHALMHRAGSLRVHNSTVVNLAVEPAGYHQVFKDLHLEFFTDKYPDDHFVTVSHAHSEDSHRSLLGLEAPLRGWFSSFLKDVWGAVKTVGKVVEDAIKTVVEVITVLATGEYDETKTLFSNTWTWNLDGNQIIRSDIPIDSDVACKGCGARADFSIDFVLLIHDYKLENVKLATRGSFSGGVGVDAQWSTAIKRDYSRVVATVHMTPIVIQVGPVPVVLKVSVPIVVGFQMEIEAQALLEAQAQVVGGFEYGVSYTPAQGIHFISQSDFDYAGSISTINGQVSASLAVYILPSVQLQVQFIGGPSIGIKGFVETNLELIVGSSTDPCVGLGGLKLTTNLGLQVTVGAFLDISFAGIILYKNTFEDKAVFSVKKPILTGCVVLGESPSIDRNSSALAFDTIPLSPAQLAVAAVDHVKPLLLTHDITSSRAVAADVVILGCAAGTSWTGIMTRGPGQSPECDQYPPYREMSFQTLSSTITGTGPILDLEGSVNDANSVDDGQTYSCVHQQRWVASVYSSNELVFALDTHDNDPYFYCSGDQPLCSCNSGVTSLPSSFFGSTDAQLDSITLEDSLLCTKLTLERVKPGTTGAFYQRPPNRTRTDACGMGPDTPTPPPAGGCCGGLPAPQCDQPLGGPCDFGCQCVSGNCNGVVCV